MKSEIIIRKLFLCLFLLGLLFKASSQNNLVPDSSFEDNYTCNSTSYNLEDYLNSWRGGRGYFNPCLISGLNGLQNIFGSQNPRTGNAYCGIYTYLINSYPIRQYIQAPLLTTLTTGKRYLVSFYVSLGDSLHAFNNSIGVYFSSDSITYLDGLLSFQPQISNDPNNQLNDMVNWVKVSDTLVAVGNEKWITIGNFLNDSLSLISPIDSVCFQPNPFGCGAYYYIDDVSVTLIDETGIEEIPKENQIMLYPNPAQHQLNISLEKPFSGRLSISNFLGQEVYILPNTNARSKFNLDVGALPGGVYILNFENESGVVRKKFVKSE